MKFKELNTKKRKKEKPAKERKYQLQDCEQRRLSTQNFTVFFFYENACLVMECLCNYV